jgi:tetratricopeptide (TPR) repeat protein
MAPFELCISTRKGLRVSLKIQRPQERLRLACPGGLTLPLYDADNFRNINFSMVDFGGKYISQNSIPAKHDTIDFRSLDSEPLERQYEVINHYLKLKIANKRNVTVLIRIATVCRQLKKFDEAIQYVRSALELQPNSAYVHCVAGWIYFSMKRFEDSFRHFQRALEIDPGINQAHNGLKIVKESMDRENAITRTRSTSEIISLKSLKGVPPRVQYNVLSDYFSRSSDNAKNYYALHYMGNVCLWLGLREEATQYYKKVLEIDPGNAYAINSLRAMAKRNKT